MDEITNVWNEIRVTGDGISITLYSERMSGSAVVEDEAWFTFDELQEQSPQSPISLNLSDESQSALVEGRRDAMKGQILETKSDLPEVREPMIDNNPPSWSEDSRVIVTEVLSDVRCDEYVIQGVNEGRIVDKPSWNDKTVADANPSYDEDEPVVLAKYADGDGDEYAFPANRLVEPGREHFPYPQAVPATR